MQMHMISRPIALAGVVLGLAACANGTQDTTPAADPAVTPATAAPAATGSEMDMGGQDIVETARGAGNFNTLLTAVERAGLVETLKGPGPYTVFAPTDEAFGAVPQATLDGLLADQQQLRSVLTYHVVEGRLTAAEVQGRSTLTTVQGAALPVRVEGGRVYVGDAEVVQADVNARNGVVHVINRVLMP